MEKHHGQGMMHTQTWVRDTQNRKHSCPKEMTLGFPRDREQPSWEPLSFTQLLLPYWSITAVDYSASPSAGLSSRRRHSFVRKEHYCSDPGSCLKQRPEHI